MKKKYAFATALAIGGLGLAGCGSDEAAPTQSGNAAATAATAPGAKPTPAISGAWARTSPATATRGAVYLKMADTSGKGDALVAAEVPASVAAKVELHETVAMGSAGTSMPMTTAGSPMATTNPMATGEMAMRPVRDIAIAPRGTTELKPGGLHIMLLDLPKPLVKGETIEVTLRFESGATMKVPVKVQDTADG